MPALMPTDHYATIVWLGSVPANPENIRSEKQDSLDLTFEGIPGGQHSGHTRSSCVRVKSQHPEFTEIANVRQLSILSAEEVAEIAAECDLENLDPKYLGASVVIEGIDDFSHIPPSSRLQAENEGIDKIFIDAGFDWRPESGCSMCLAMNDDIAMDGERIASSTNRNFEGRQGRGARTHLMSPAMVAAAAVKGHLADVRKFQTEGAE